MLWLVEEEAVAGFEYFNVGAPLGKGLEVLAADTSRVAQRLDVSNSEDTPTTFIIAHQRAKLRTILI